jgi:List-Bact-rpt repeat protein
MRIQYNRTCLPSIWTLVFIAVLAACGSDSSNGQTVAVNLSLIVDGRQAQHHPPISRLFAWIERWFPGTTPAWAQSVTEIASIQVQITGPGIPTPASTTVPVSDPTSGQEIPVSIQAPVGPNRTITVTAFNAASPPLKIFGGTLPGVNLTAGPPIDLEITLVRLFTVSVQKAGEGSGTVTSSLAGINCGATCVSQFQEGTTVSLNAAADAGSVFAGWSGACSGTAACFVNDNATVAARFNVAASTNRLTVTVGGSGIGIVTSNPSGISCPGTCAAQFATGTNVTLTATPTSESTFNGFSGAGCSGPGSSCAVAMNGDQNVTATFTATTPIPMSTLSVQKIGSGSGTVTSANQAGINCGSTCGASFPTNSLVTLTATPATGSTFIGWSNGCTGTGSCDVTLTSDQTIVAQFDLVPDLVTLSVNTSGPGDGTVTSDQGGISCPSSCTASFPRGTTVVTLTAVPNGPSVFAGWRGGTCEAFGIAPCMITMDDNRTANARFERFGR